MPEKNIETEKLSTVTLRERYGLNIKRVRSLLEIYKVMTPKIQGRKDVTRTDILRSAVVLLHATLEDFLRNLLLLNWEKFSEADLNSIPFSDPLNLNNPRADNFKLGKLLQHKEKSVEGLIYESVDNYFNEKLNFNQGNDVANWLKKMGITFDNLGGQYLEMFKMMKRRHLIVHQADRNRNLKQGRHSTSSISIDVVETWISSVDDFVEDVFTRNAGASQ